jgi:hypothetical protein
MDTKAVNTAEEISKAMQTLSDARFLEGFRACQLLASTAVAALVDGDSPQWDGALTDALRAIDDLRPPKK